ASGGGALISEKVALAHVEIEVDRINRNDGREYRRIDAGTADDEIPLGDRVTSDAAADWGGGMGPFHIQLRRVDGGLCYGHAGVVGGRFAQTLVILCGRDEIAFAQLARTIELAVRHIELRLGLLQLRLGGPQSDVERTRVDDVQQITL